MELREKYQGEGVHFLAVAPPSLEAQADAAVERLGFDWTQAFPDSEWTAAIGASALPTTVWIEANGNVKRVAVGAQEPEDMDRWTAEIVPH